MLFNSQLCNQGLPPRGSIYIHFSLKHPLSHFNLDLLVLAVPPVLTEQHQMFDHSAQNKNKALYLNIEFDQCIINEKLIVVI